MTWRRQWCWTIILPGLSSFTVIPASPCGTTHHALTCTQVFESLLGLHWITCGHIVLKLAARVAGSNHMIIYSSHRQFHPNSTVSRTSNLKIRCHSNCSIVKTLQSWCGCWSVRCLIDELSSPLPYILSVASGKPFHKILIRIQAKKAIPDVSRHPWDLSLHDFRTELEPQSLTWIPTPDPWL